MNHLKKIEDRVISILKTKAPNSSLNKALR